MNKYRQYHFYNGNLLRILYTKKLPQTAIKMKCISGPVWTTPDRLGFYSKIVLIDSEITFATGKKEEGFYQ